MSRLQRLEGRLDQSFVAVRSAVESGARDCVPKAKRYREMPSRGELAVA